jgi:hypothetical protein
MLGLTMWEALSGAPPFAHIADPLAAALAAAAADPAQRAVLDWNAVPAVPQALREVLARCTAFDRAARPSAAKVAAEARAALAALGPPEPAVVAAAAAPAAAAAAATACAVRSLMGPLTAGAVWQEEGTAGEQEQERERERQQQQQEAAVAAASDAAASKNDIEAVLRTVERVRRDVEEMRDELAGGDL